MARSNRQFFRLKLGSTTVFGIGTVTGLNRHRNASKVFDGDTAKEATSIVGAVVHDDVTFKCALIAGGKQDTVQPLEDMLLAHGTNDPDVTTTLTNGTVTFYADAEFQTTVGSYSLNRCKLTGFKIDDMDRADESGAAVQIEGTLSVGAGAWKGGSATTAP